MNPMQPPENQVPGQPPTGAPPGMMPSSIDFAAFTAPENRSYLIAAIGSLVALLSFFILPFWGYSFNSTVPGATGSFSGSVTASTATNGYGLLWFVALGALVALAVACLLVLGIQAISQLTPQLGARIILGSGIIALAILLIIGLKINSDASASGLGTFNLGQTGFSAGLGLGFWLMLLSLIAVIVGGVMNMRQVQGVSMSRPAM